MLKLLSTFFLFCFLSSIYAQISVSGSIIDSENGESLFMANAYIQGQNITGVSNEYGYYSLQIDTGRIRQQNFHLVISYIGYKSDTIVFSREKSIRFDVKLKPAIQKIGQVRVSAAARRNQEIVNSTQVGLVTMRMKELQHIPTIGGEKDIIKTMQLLPGIASGTEGTTDFFVRGGDGDQNLILLDEATVYNVGHLFGFFSVFNTDALKDLSIYKGGFPSYYGGRLSSILDVTQRDGNQKQWEVTGGIGLVSSRLTVEGPLLKEKGSILVSGRRTYIDQVASLASVALPYYFYDLNWKANYQIDKNNRLFYSGYLGDDVLSVDEDDNFGDDDAPEEEEEDFDFRFGFNLGNITHTLRWNHIFNSKLFSNVTLTTTNFDYDIFGQIDSNNLLIKSKIQDIALKAKFSYYKSEKSTISYGAEIINHSFRPNIISTSGEISEFLESSDGGKIDFQEIAIYAHEEIELVEHIWKLNYGVRLSSAITDGKFYAGIEPRISARYSLNEFSSLKASLTRMKQYMHRVSSSTISLPTDLWYPVTQSIKPQRADQASVGYFRNLKKLKSIFSTEVFYKQMGNLIEYREGSNLLLNDDFESDLVQGDGRAYGIEFLIKKDEGRLTGWIGYTLSRSERDFDMLNGGKVFPAKYDRRHDLSIVGSYDVSKRFSVGAVWVYASGANFTAQIGQYLVPNVALTGIDVIPIYSERNAVQMSPSHRLDLNITIKPKKERRWYGEWQIGCYNLYNRSTPYRIDIRTNTVDTPNGQEVSRQYEQPGLFGFVPYFTYNFKFK